MKLPVVVYYHSRGFTAGDNDISPSIHGNIGKIQFIPYHLIFHFSVSLTKSRSFLHFQQLYLRPSHLPPGSHSYLPSRRRRRHFFFKMASTEHRSTRWQSLLHHSPRSISGGAHLATALFTGLLNPILPNIKGINLQSAPLYYNLALPRRRQNMESYHQTTDHAIIMAKTAVEMFKKCEKEVVEKWPRLLITLGEFDFEECVEGNLRFVGEWRAKMGRLPVVEVLEGQNHVSYGLGMGLQGEKVGARLLRFVEVMR